LLKITRTHQPLLSGKATSQISRWSEASRGRCAEAIA
jgi:hypothetical protein